MGHSLKCYIPCRIWTRHLVQYLDIHTYIHIWPLQPFSQDYGLDSHTTIVVCVNLIREWRDLQFNVASERQIFGKFYHGRLVYLRSEFLPEICWEKKSPKKYFSYFIFDDWPRIRTQAFATTATTIFYLYYIRPSIIYFTIALFCQTNILYILKYMLPQSLLYWTQLYIASNIFVLFIWHSKIFISIIKARGRITDARKQFIKTREIFAFIKILYGFTTIWKVSDLFVYMCA